MAEAAPNPYVPSLARITHVTDETYDTKTFRLEFEDEALRESFTYRSGQFAELSVFGFGEATFDISSSPCRRGFLEFTIRRTGKVTDALHGMGPGDQVGLRGPYGNGWPLEAWEGKNLVFIGGGVGLPPLRTCLNEVLAPENRGKYGSIQIVYGARSPRDLVHTSEYDEWRAAPDCTLHLTVDAGDENWTGKVGFVPTLLDEVAPSADNTIALTVGPPIMIKFVLQGLEKLGFAPEAIFTNLENRMKCGIGKCGRCNIGGKFVCVDGPVCAYAQIQELAADY